jgi:predicted MarR family transcription regulator
MAKSRIVSSSYLVTEGAAETSELEYGLFVATNPFNRWIVRCMTAPGFPDLSPLDAMVQHTVNHRDRQKKPAYICLTSNIEDTHTVDYALKKLLKAEPPRCPTARTRERSIRRVLRARMLASATARFETPVSSEH